jgi:hypothetical protein
VTATTAPYHSELPRCRDGFAQSVRAEWTKFRTVLGRMIATFASVIVIVLAACGATQSTNSCTSPSCGVPVGPGGEAVTDNYYFVHRTLAGSGSITVRVSLLTGRIQAGPGNVVTPSDLVGVPSRVQPWAKAGLIVTPSTNPGSAYAAVMVTGGHGVRMQYDYTHDTAGTAGAAGSPQWLRLTRSGGTLTGYASADGFHWAKIGAAHLAGLPATVQAGLFVTSPQTAQLAQGESSSFMQQATAATAAFDRLGLQGAWRSGAWQAENVGPEPNNANPTNAMPILSSVGYHRSGGGFTVSGSGDIAPAVGIPAGQTAAQPLHGVFVGLIVLIVVASMFVTAEYRRGLILTTFAATPRRGRVLAAKAIVVGSVAFFAIAVAAGIALPLGLHNLRARGNYIYPTTTLTDLRLIVGTAALVALTAVLAVAVGAALRRSAVAVCIVMVLIVFPYVLTITAALPAGVSQWLARLTPAAAFAVQQTLPQYHQVSYQYTPANDFYPLTPAAGLAVLAGYALIALALAGYLLRTRDA